MTDIAHAAAGRHVVAPATHAAYLALMLDWAHGDRLLALMQWGRTALAVMLAYAILPQPMLASLAMAQVGDHSSIERMLLVICSPFGDGQTDDTSQAVHVSPCCLVSQRAVLDHPEVQALLIDWLPSLES